MKIPRKRIIDWVIFRAWCGDAAFQLCNKGKSSYYCNFIGEDCRIDSCPLWKQLKEPNQ